MKYKITIDILTKKPDKTYEDKETVYEQVVEGENKTLVVDVIQAINKLV